MRNFVKRFTARSPLSCSECVARGAGAGRCSAEGKNSFTWGSADRIVRPLF
jgi:hypothetical protein